MSEDLNVVEQYMQSSLTPVVPRPEFVHQLHRRLVDPTIPTIRFDNNNLSIKHLFVVFASIVSGIVLVVTASRAISMIFRNFRAYH